MHTPGKYALVNVFAGKANLSKAFAEHGHGVCTLDFERDEADVLCLT